MQQEAAEAEKQRRDLAKQFGNSGTKLLMPMMLLLIIVSIVMVPVSAM